MGSKYDSTLGSEAPWVQRARRGFPLGLGGMTGFITNPAVGAIAGVAGSVLQNVWSARRADTAHQREVKDLLAAGLNPALSATGGRGSEVGPMQNPMEGVSSALGVQRQKAEIQLIRAQTKATLSQSAESMTRVGQITTKTPVEVDQIIANTGLANANREQLEKLRDATLERIKAEVTSLVASAKRTDALAALDKLDITRAENIAKFEARMGEMTPALRMSFEFLRAIATIMNQPTRR